MPEEVLPGLLGLVRPHALPLCVSPDLRGVIEHAPELLQLRLAIADVDDVMRGDEPAPYKLLYDSLTVGLDKQRLELLRELRVDARYASDMNRSSIQPSRL